MTCLRTTEMVPTSGNPPRRNDEMSQMVNLSVENPFGLHLKITGVARLVGWPAGVY